MFLSPLIRRSFFLRFLLLTIVAGNVYLSLQAAAHAFNFHGLDNYLRWYAFKATPVYNLVLFAGAFFTLLGAISISRKGPAGFGLYLAGKILTLLAFILLTLLEYRHDETPYPLILLPVLLGVEALYPVVLYISLRKTKTKSLV